MNARIKLKKKKQKSYLIFLSKVLSLAFIISFFLILLTGKKLEKVIVRYASIETKRIASVILDDVVREKVVIPNLYQVQRNSDNELEMINFNTEEVNKLLKDVNEQARKRLLALEDGNTKDIALSNALKGVSFASLKNGVVCEIPLGVLLGNSLLVGTSSVIPIRFSFVGSVESNLESKVSSYGMNNALVELSIKVTITEQITMPHTAKEVVLSSSIPLVSSIIEGKVPFYYQDYNDEKTKQTLSIFP